MRNLNSLAGAAAVLLAPLAAQAEPLKAQGETLAGLGVTIVEDDRHGVTGEFGFRVEGVLKEAGALKDVGIAIEPTLHATAEFNKDNKLGGLAGAGICVGPTLDIGEKDGVKLNGGFRAEITGPSTFGPKGWASGEAGFYFGGGFSVAEARVTSMYNLRTGTNETKFMLVWTSEIY